MLGGALAGGGIGGRKRKGKECREEVKGQQDKGLIRGGGIYC